MGRPFATESQQEASAEAQSRRAATLQRWRDLVTENVQGIDSELVTSVLEWVYGQRRSAYSMKVEQPAQPLDPTASKVGGLPFLLPGESWPVSQHPDHAGTQLMFVWQLRIDEMPAEMQAMLGRQDGGLFQFFLDEELPGYDIQKDKDYYCVRILTPQQVAEPPQLSPPQPSSETKVLTEKAITGWQEVEDFPHLEDWDASLAPDRDVADTIIEVLNNASEAECVGGDKALGWPRWCQGPEWATVAAGEGEEAEPASAGSSRRYLQFLQFEAEHCDNEFIVGDAGTLVIQRDPLGKTPPEFAVGWACC